MRLTVTHDETIEMDKLQQMASFVAVVEAGSFIGAADATQQTKAAVSRHVADLERRLGVRLLHRTTRRLSLSDDGQTFYARARELLTGVAEAESEISARRGEASGLLRVTAPLSFGVLHLAPLWGRFIEANPKVSLDVTLSDRVSDLVEEGFDLAVRVAQLPSSTLVSRQLASTRIVLCASPGYIKKHKAPKHPSELAEHRVIGYSYWSERDEWSFDGPGGKQRVSVKPRMHSNNGDTCRAAALRHQGIILQPDFLVGEDLQRGDLVELLPEYKAPTLGVHAVYPSRKHPPLKLRRLIDFLAAAFKHPLWTAAP